VKGILMKPWKAQAIHESSPETEWQIRRIIKEQKLWWVDVQPHPNGGWVAADFNISEANYRPTGIGFKCPYTIGEHVYIKETWAVAPMAIHYKSDNSFMGVEKHLIEPLYGITGWRSPLHMPAWAARTIIEIPDIRAQRVQEISEEDAIAEGCPQYVIDGKGDWDMVNRIKIWFYSLWNSIYPGSWERNDFCWVYSLRRIER